MLVRFDPFRDSSALAGMVAPRDPARPAAIPVDAFRQVDRFVVRERPRAPSCASSSSARAA